MDKKESMPIWVYLGLWGMKKRKVAQLFLWLSILIGLASFPLALFFKKAIFGVGMLLAALWYWAAIKWADQHSSWE